MTHNPDDRQIAIVLGAAVWPGGEPSPSLRRRAEHAAKLWQDGMVSAIIGSGGVGKHPPSEAQVIADICRAKGVPEACILQEDKATTTEENLRFSARLLAEHGAVSAVLVTDAYHAPRALLVARRLGMKATASCPKMTGTTWRRVIKAWMREIPALIWYVLHGKGRP
ncbi:YdcF family protein [uncultured Pelagimonas sp.]|uniref:YdcF family protein n=1 Tax=uncultured Pelagimonas sp. TaxID=1618102 RepID=UPI00262BBEEF|nr:YdcF family protein [uncultured Pelagimonas sp.]